MTDPVSTGGYTPISQVLASSAATTSAAKSSSQGGQLDKNAFLNLLVAQLKYQDPSSPVDSSQFMSQTAQFQQVESLDSLSATQTQLLSTQQMLSAASMVGKTVSFPDSDGTDATGVVTAARFSSDGPVLRVGDKDVPLSSVLQVTATASA
jgi:flagellar basal-body rod modification protein FlgD